jgi:hypothetical protein
MCVISTNTLGVHNKTPRSIPLLTVQYPETNLVVQGAGANGGQRSPYKSIHNCFYTGLSNSTNRGDRAVPESQCRAPSSITG